MGSARRLEGRAAVLALVAATAAALAYAYTFAFSQFVPYDDEGYVTVTVQHLLDGHRLYDDVPLGYGPFFYLSRWLIYGTLHVPLVTDAVRLITIGHWLLCAALLTAVTYRLSHRQDGRLVLATMTLVAMTLHLSTAAREPGHPQELAALLIVAACLLGTVVSAGQRGLVCGLLGAAAGASLLVKINVGGFFAAGTAVALVLLGPTGGWWRVARRGSIVVMALPFVLMRRDVGQLWARSSAPWLRSDRFGLDRGVPSRARRALYGPRPLPLSGRHALCNGRERGIHPATRLLAPGTVEQRRAASDAVSVPIRLARSDQRLCGALRLGGGRVVAALRGGRRTDTRAAGISGPPPVQARCCSVRDRGGAHLAGDTADLGTGLPLARAGAAARGALVIAGGVRPDAALPDRRSSGPDRLPGSR